MSSCYDGSFLCQLPCYPEFDEIATCELLQPPTVHQIVNESTFCTHLPIDEADIIGDLTHRMYLKGLNAKTGLYHLWVDYENCTDHHTHTMKCIYVGKGYAEGRISCHIDHNVPKGTGVSVYASFYECSNRMSKYLEQLFLDTYSFALNNYENPGTRPLYAVWDEQRHLLGTELNAVSRLSSLRSMDDL